jgi:hypothetical protein
MWRGDRKATDEPSDVGGGSVKNIETTDLANTSLVWMVNEVIAAGVGLVFKEDAFSDIPALQFPTTGVSDPLPVGDHNKHLSDKPGAYSSRRDFMTTDATVTSDAGPLSKFTFRSTSTRETTQGLVTVSSISHKGILADATRKAYDALAGWTPYWLLEWFPRPFYYQDANNDWHSNWQYVCLFSPRCDI